MQNQDIEAELIARSMDGDSTAYGALIDRYKNALYRHCFAIVRNEDTAEDIAQETFITAYYKLHTYNSSYRLSTWLFKIATNKALTWLKKASREVRADDELIARIASRAPGPAEEATFSELRQARREPTTKTPRRSEPVLLARIKLSGNRHRTCVANWQRQGMDAPRQTTT